MINKVRLVNFRLFKESEFTFTENVNIISGPNGIGKTSLVEAILVGLQGSSYRVKDKDLVSYGSEWLRIELDLDKEKRLIKIDNLKTLKTFEVNDNKYKRLTREHKIPVVLFEPGNLNLLSSSPESRRNYLDQILKQINPDYTSWLNKYNKALIQRNYILKNPTPNIKEALFPWNIRVTQLAENIVQARVNLVELINANLGDIYKDISKKEEVVSLVYKPKFSIDNYSTGYLKALEENLNKDLAIGHTSTGPHREDFSIMFDNFEANTHASRGEIRSAILSLKICEIKIIDQTLKKKAVLLLDDVFSELDASRRHNLTKILDSHQSFITTTDADIAKKEFKGYCNLIQLVAE